MNAATDQPHNQTNDSDNRTTVTLFVLMFFIVGWLSGTIVRVIPGGFLENVRLAFTNHYLALSSTAVGPRVFYVMTEDRSVLIEELSGWPAVSRVEPTFLDNIAIVETSENVTAVFNNVRRLPYVDTITSIPLFCH